MSAILDGSDYITGAIVANNSQGAASLWVKRTVSTGGGALFDTDAARHQYVAVDVDLAAFTSHIAGSGFTYTTAAQLGGSWQHVLMCWKTAGALSDIYLGGTLISGSGSAFSDVTVPTQITLGARFSQASSFLTGRIAEFALYDLYATQETATALAGGASPQSVAAANLSHYHRLNGDLLPTVGGVTLSTGGATFDGADNPTVATYSAAVVSTSRKKRRSAASLGWK